MNTPIPETAKNFAEALLDALSDGACGCEQCQKVATDHFSRALLARDERAAKEEREACAKIADYEANISPSSVIVPAVARHIASAIRDRTKP